MLSPPGSDQIEISLFGPGYGELCAIHIGSGRWIVINSCIDTTSKQPASLTYLRDVGVDPSTSVLLVIATHWHDDHIRGLAQVVRECKRATICLSAALGQKEFLEAVAAFNQRSGIAAGSGVSELAEIYAYLAQSGKHATKALPNRLLLSVPGTALDHSLPCDVWSLSPSDKQFDLSIAAIGNLLPLVKTTKHRMPDQTPNHLSVVTWIRLGNFAILMGADLEEPGDPDLGWSAVIKNQSRPTGRAAIFKIPHHGSITGHHPLVWTELLDQSPITVLTPWNRGGGLPTAADVERISRLSGASLSTSRFLGGRVRKRSPVVEKQIKLTVGKIRPAQPRTGQVRIRNAGSNKVDLWSVELINDACDLLDLLATQ